MPRRARRVGVKYIEDYRERDITFFKRRAGLCKGAADLSALTGASIAVVLEAENGKMHSFGTPSADPIVDTFLAGGPRAGPFAGEQLKATIARLQNELVQLENLNMEEGKRTKLSTERTREVQDQSSTTAAKLAFHKVEELNLDQLNQMLSDLLRVQQDISHRLPDPLHHGRELEIGGPSVPPPQWPSPPPQNPLLSQGSSSSARSLPPRIPPLQSSWSHLFPLRPPSSFPNLQVPSLQLPPSSSTPQRTQLAPLPTVQAPPLGQHMPLGTEAQPYNRHIWGLEIDGNGTPPQPLQSPFLPSAPPRASTLLQPLPDQLPHLPPSLQVPPQNYANPYNPVELPQNYENPYNHVGLPQNYTNPYNPVELPHNYAEPNSAFHGEELSQLLGGAGGNDFPAGDPFGHDQWASVLVDQQYYNLLGLNADLGSAGGSLGQDGGGYGMFGGTGLPTYDGWVDAPPESSSGGGNGGRAGAGY